MLDTAPSTESEPAVTPTLGHGLIASRLQRALGDIVEDRGPGPVFSAQTSFRVGSEPKDPDLAVEIASRTDTLSTICRKVRAYIGAGVQAVWVVNPWLRTVEVFRPDGHNTLLSEAESLHGDPVVPGFSVDLARIFPS